MTAEQDIAAIADGGDNPPSRVRTALTAVLNQTEAISLRGLVGWYDAAALDGLSDDDPVTTVPPQFGGMWMANVDEALFKTSVLNSLPVLRFDGTDDGYNTELFADASVGVAEMVQYTAFTVFRHRTGTPSGDEMIFGGDDNTSGADGSFFAGVDGSNIFVSNGSKLNGPAVDDEWHRITVTRTSTGSTLDVDGSSFGPSGTGSLHPAFLSLGLRRNTFDGLTTGNHFDGDTAEAIVYNRVLTSAEIGVVESYLASKWDL